MPIATFNATWSGQDCGATAVITLDTDLVKVVAGASSPIAMSQIQALTVTVQGAAAGNGTFSKADFSGVNFYSKIALDFSKPLVGQTDGTGQPFGTLDAQGGAGDFNLISAGPAPNGVYAFALGTNGAQDPVDLLKLDSLTPNP